MSSMRIWIVEDNLSFALDLEMFAEELGHEILGISSKGEDALPAITDQLPDLIIMDINLEGEMNGLDLAQKLEHTEIPILFITVHDRPDYFQQARKTNWAGYLVKPFDKLSLQAALEIALRAPKTEHLPEELSFLSNECILIKSQGIYFKVQFCDIDFIQSEGNYCMIHTNGKKFAIKISLRQLLDNLPQSQFVQIQKSYAVQQKRIEAIDAAENLVIIGAHRLPLGKGYRDSLLARFRVLK